MNVWCHLPTIFSQRRTLQIAGLLTLCVALITTLFLSVVVNATPGVNQTISFQGRLLDSQNNVVPDGYYNIQFKIYQDGSGTEAGNPDGTLKWTETHINNGGNNGVFVKNGYLSVDLGSKTPFGTSVDWNQSTLWLSMNIAGSSSVCTTFGTAPCLADGEMLPMKRLTATPYSLNSAKLEGKSASDFIQNGTTQQTGDFNISGTGTVTTLQGSTSVIAPLFDTPQQSGILSIGTVNASTINIGTNAYAQNINIGTSADGIKNVTVGSTTSNSATLLQGGNMGVRVATTGGFVVHTNQSGNDTLVINQGGSIAMNLESGAGFSVKNSSDQGLLDITNTGTITTAHSSLLQVNGSAVFNKGVDIQGSTTYQTPGGYSMNSAINIANYAVPQFSSIFAFGLPADSASTARGMIVADARTTAHQATIGVLSPDENQIMGLSYNGSNTTGYLTNTGNSLALQGGGLDLLTATNSGGQAKVGIGNNASSGYALDVTGGINASDEYSINGVSVLNNSGLNFSGATTSTIAAASGQTLQLTGSSVQIGDGTASGEPTLLTVDKSGTTPTASGDTALGSMYYDTTLGKVQCYEADGWGSCSSSPDTYVSLSPQYANSVFNGNGTGTLDAEFCSGTLGINDGSAGQPLYCAENETYNLYKWTTTLGTPQSRSIYVTHQLPANFKRFVSGTTSIMAARMANANTEFQVYKSTSTGLVACGSPTAATDIYSWQKLNATGSADPANCSFAAGDSIVFKITLTSQSDDLAAVSTIGFAYNND